MFRTYWSARYAEEINWSPLEEYFDSFEARARSIFERMCEDCIFTVTNGDGVYNPFRKGRRERDKESRIPNPLDSGPNQLCIPCENAWLDELNYGWELYCERRIDCIGWAEGILTVRFTVRAKTIRIFGAGYWRKGRKIYEEQN